MAFVKVDRDDTIVYFVNDDPRLASMWGGELSLVELKDLSDCEKKFWEWQTRLEKFTRCKCDTFAMEHPRNKYCMNSKSKSMQRRKK